MCEGGEPLVLEARTDGCERAPRAGTDLAAWLAGIPEAPEGRALALTDKPSFDALLRREQPGTSDLSFTNLFAWQETHPVFLARVGGTLLIWRGPERSGALLAPLGPLDARVIDRAFEFSEAHGGAGAFRRVPERIAAALIAAEPSLAMNADRDQADYVYRTTDLATLAGRRFDGKRNQIKKFERSVVATYIPIAPDLLVEVADAQRRWCDDRQCAIHADLAAEHRAVLRALEHWDELGLLGGALVTEGRVIAFGIAEPLLPDTAVVHFEKGDTRFPGVYQAMGRAFAERALAGFTFVNREQDLGIEGLRKAKLSYQPHHLIPKFDVVRRAA